MEPDAPSEPLFRSTKRRKILRKRTDVDDGNTTSPSSRSPATDANVAITKHGGEDDQPDASGVTRMQKRGGVRKQGIGFSSTDPRRKAVQDEGDQLALVPIGNEGAQQVVQNDRFVKPTGRVGVTEDKHMTAYIDSKLAESRTPTTDLLASINVQTPPSKPAAPSERIENADVSNGRGTNANFRQNVDDHAQSRTTRNYQRPTKRRSKPARHETDVARDSMIDQIMRENQVPIYDRSVSQTPTMDADDMDNDEAAAEAFKAQLLADLEQNRRRRPPPSKTATTASTGPKLGGSRSQRERMKALEEAKGGKT